MRLSGQQYQQFVKALLNAFPTVAKLRLLVRFRLDQNLDQLALGNDLAEMFSKLIGAVKAGGWTTHRIVGARESIPGTAALLVCAQQLAIAVSALTKPLNLTIDTNAIIAVNADGLRVTYRTNADPGSSGSPCFDSSWSVVTLHHGSDASPIPGYTEGCLMSAIRAPLKQRGPLNQGER